MSAAEATRPAPIEPMAQLAALEGLSPTTAFRLRAGLRPRLIRTADELLLRTVDDRISLPPAAESALKLVLSGEMAELRHGSETLEDVFVRVVGADRSTESLDWL